MDILTDLAAPVITGLVTLCGLIVANRKAAAVKAAKDELKEQELAAWRQDVSQHLNEHNDYARLFQTYVSEHNVTLARIDERLKVLEERR